MPVRTFPDHGRSFGSFTAPDIDLTELAARIKSIDTIRREGKVIFLDPFEVVIWKFITGGGTGSKFEIVSTPVLRGFSSGKFTPGSTTPWESAIEKQFPSLTDRRYGVEITPSPGSTSGTGYLLSVNVQREVNTSGARGGIQIDYENASLNYVDSGGLWAKLTNINNPKNGMPQWANLKIVLDFLTLQTVRCEWGENIYPIDTPLYTWTPGADLGDKFIVNIAAKSTDGSSNPVYITDFILTIDEP